MCAVSEASAASTSYSSVLGSSSESKIVIISIGCGSDDTATTDGAAAAAGTVAVSPFIIFIAKESNTFGSMPFDTTEIR